MTLYELVPTYTVFKCKVYHHLIDSKSNFLIGLCRITAKPKKKTDILQRTSDYHQKPLANKFVTYTSVRGELTY